MASLLSWWHVCGSVSSVFHLPAYVSRNSVTPEIFLSKTGTHGIQPCLIVRHNLVCNSVRIRNESWVCKKYSIDCAFSLLVALYATQHLYTSLLDALVNKYRCTCPAWTLCKGCNPRPQCNGAANNDLKSHQTNVSKDLGIA